MVEEGIKSVPLLLQPQIVVLRRELFCDDAVLQTTLRLRHDHNVNDHVLRESDGGPKVPKIKKTKLLLLADRTLYVRADYPKTWFHRGN